MEYLHPSQTTPTDFLKSEHQVILKVLGAFETMVKQVEVGGDPDGELWGHAVEFFRGFADRIHHAKEEDLLFPAMEDAGIPRQGGPVGVMLEEHDHGRAYMGEIRNGIRMLPDQSDEAKQKLVTNGWAFIQMLQAHIQKEDEILFPMADRAIGPQQMQELSRSFQSTQSRLEDNARRFLKMAEEIESRTNV